MAKGFRNNFIWYFGLIFLSVGFVILAVAVGIGISNWRFSARAAKAQGVVKSIAQRTDNDGDTMYYPVIQFQESGGRAISFEGNGSGSVGAYRVGDQVEVLYDPDQPADARTSSSFPVGMLICGILGLVFSSIGGGFTFYQYKKWQMQAWLRGNGQPIHARLLSSQLDQSLEVNGQNPYRVIAQVQHPVTGAVHVFKSDAVWYNPDPFLKSDSIVVLVDPNDYRRYFIDLSWLPPTG